MTDEALMEAWQGGDVDAADSLIKRLHPQVRRFFASKVHEPDDLVQRTFEALVQHKDRYRGDAKVRTFVYAIATNLLRKHFRSLAGPRGKVDLGTASVEDLQPSPSSAIAARDDQRLLLRARRHLSVEQQNLLELHYVQNLKVAEIAWALELPVGTVKTRMRAARKQLRELIERLADSPGLLQSTITRMEQWAAPVEGDSALAP